ncbi:hypothetical protein N9230_04325 [Akkermansiaceae bacterium]|jgi:hypothetical protein|nr:hypothetical protein [Akkermansiaceae bacterium]
MKQNWVIIRTVAALAVIFGSGVWVGHSFSPQESVEIVFPERPGLAGKPGQPNKLEPVQARIVKTYRRNLNLTHEQMEQFLVLFEEQREVVYSLPKGHSPEKTEKIRAFHEKLRPILKPEQLPGLDRMMEEIESRQRGQR